MTEKQTDHLYSVIGRNVKRRREILDISQIELAKRLYYTRSYVWSIETGRKMIRIHELISVAQALGCTILDLMSNEPT